MASLDLHSRTPDIEKHARLAFRGDCPTCRRVRLHGSLPAPELVPTRTKAALAAGMMLASLSAPPATALAQDAPATDSGAQILPPGDSGPATPGQSDHGGSPGDGSPGGEHSGAGAAQPGAPADASPASAPAPPPADAPQPAPAPASHSQSGTRGGSLGSSGAPTGHHERFASPAARSPASAPDPQGSRSARSSPPVARPSAPASPPPPAASRGASAAESGSRTSHHAHGRTNTPPTTGHPHRSAGEKRKNPGVAVHVVKEGESLWLIARHALGPHASDAQIAELVSDLWNRNAGRIATGNPNLIQPGQTLEMPA